MRAVLDTNVLISGLFFGGAPGRVLEAWRDGRFELVISPEVFAEYLRVGERLADRFPGVEVAPFLDLVAASASFVIPAPLPKPASADHDDDKFIECALSGGAECIVSGDRDLLEVSGYQGVEVIRPRALLDLLATKGEA